MSTYNISLDNNVMSISFGVKADNDQIVKDADAALAQLKLGGGLLKITGAASLPVAFVITHRVCHLYKAIAVCDKI